MKKAFTLIELLVVVAIIGILATVVVVNMSSAQNKARDAKVKADMETVQKAASLYYTENGTYPSLNCNPSGTTCNSQTSTDTHTTTIINAAKDLANTSDGMTFISSASAYQAYSKLPSARGSSLEKSVCVDSRGKIGTTSRAHEPYLLFNSSGANITFPITSQYYTPPFSIALTFQVNNYVDSPLIRVSNGATTLYTIFAWSSATDQFPTSLYFQTPPADQLSQYHKLSRDTKYTAIWTFDSSNNGISYLYDSSGNLLFTQVKNNMSPLGSAVADTMTLGSGMAQNGRIYDFKYWSNKIISASDANTIAKGGDFSSGLYSWWPMTAATGNKIVNAVGNGDGAINSGSTAWGSDPSTNTYCTSDTK